MDNFPSIRFTGTLRPSQIEVVEIAKRQLATGERKIHVVAPPGSGKTVLGLYLWAECILVPALVLSPNSAIQAQWVDPSHLPPPRMPTLRKTRHHQRSDDWLKSEVV
jgi:superfamily II DNA or RNA helicase